MRLRLGCRHGRFGWGDGQEHMLLIGLERLDFLGEPFVLLIGGLKELILLERLKESIQYGRKKSNAAAAMSTKTMGAKNHAIAYPSRNNPRLLRIRMLTDAELFACRILICNRFAKP